MADKQHRGAVFLAQYLDEIDNPRLVTGDTLSGLSWLTILRKRDNFRAAFDGFDPATVAAYGPSELQRLLGDAGIVRHRGKIESTINNARRMLELEAEHGSLYRWVQQFRPAPTRLRVDSKFRSTCPESVAMSKALKRRGWSFVGPTTVYAFMQAMGLVDDHIEGCERRPSRGT